MSLHLGHATGKLSGSLAGSPARKPLLEPPADVANEGLVREHISHAPGQPAAVAFCVAQPALQPGIVESICELSCQALAPGGDEVGSLVMDNRPRCVNPAMLLLHLLEDTWKNMLYELRNVRAVVQASWQPGITESLVAVANVDEHLAASKYWSPVNLVLRSALGLCSRGSAKVHAVEAGPR